MLILLFRHFFRKLCGWWKEISTQFYFLTSEKNTNTLARNPFYFRERVDAHGLRLKKGEQFTWKRSGGVEFLMIISSFFSEKEDNKCPEVVSSSQETEKKEKSNLNCFVVAMEMKKLFVRN
jgi:hypothetical protein